MFNRDFAIFQCCKCQHGFLRPLPTFQELDSIYSNDATNDACNSSDEYISKSVGHYSDIFMHCISPLFLKTGRLLDVGAGIGTFVATALEFGWDAVGVEFNKSATMIAKQKFGATLIQGSFYELETWFPAEFFDLISFIHVFEHIPNPVAYANYVAQFLRPCGCILLAVPNIGSDEFKNYGPRWSYLHIPAHVSYFNCESLDEVFLRRTKLEYGYFEKMFQSTFPGTGMKQGEAITSIYRLVGKQRASLLQYSSGQHAVAWNSSAMPLFMSSRLT